MPTASRFLKAMEKAQSEIRDLDLTGLDDDAVQIRPLGRADVQTMVLESGKIKTPAVIIHIGGSETITSAENATYDMIYPVAVTIVERPSGANAVAETDFDSIIDKREKIIDQMIDQNYSVDVPGCFKTEVATFRGVDTPAWKQSSFLISSFNVLFHCEVNRRAA